MASAHGTLRASDQRRRICEQVIQSVPAENRFKRNGSAFSCLGKRGLGVPHIARIFGRFQSPQVLCRNNRRHRLPVTFNDHPFATVFGATKEIGESILRFGNAHRGHRPL